MKKRNTIFFIMLFCLTALISKAQSWSTTGNTGINPATNFLGTKDSKALILKTNNTERMRILPNGYIGIGLKNPVQILDVNGNINISSGSSFYVDNHKLISTDLSTLNLFLGTGAGTIGISGSGNASAGNNALYSITSGNSNTAVGTAALFSNATASYNTAIGHTALYSNLSGYDQTATGDQALFSNTKGYCNTADGVGSLYSNTVGANNTAIGWEALNANTTSSNNTAVGKMAGALFDNGSYNTFIGADARTELPFMSNAMALGYGARAGSNQVAIGNSSVTSIGGFVNWTNISDKRVKRNIKENVPGLVFINKLKAVTYNLDLDEADRIIKSKDEGRKFSQEEKDARIAKQKIVYTGFIAQDVERVAKELNYDFSGVDVAKNNKDLYGLRYAEFVVPLVKAVQELDENQKSKIKSLNEQINDLKKEIEELKNIIKSNQLNTHVSDKPQIVHVASALLEQNVPNPFNSTTKINYTLPQQYSSAKIIITDKFGKAIKAIDINRSGKGNITADVAAFASGTYQYSLIVDEKLIDTKQMVLTK